MSVSERLGGNDASKTKRCELPENPSIALTIVV